MKKVNRAFLIIFVPAILVAVGYWAVTARLGVRLELTRLVAAGAGFLAAAGVVYLYRRRKARPRGN
ncbi:MAG TPA: hypothetical protein VKE24_13045 [Candidatus Acidoferrales bacterium]|nr:hypothetical protein [Candidatus Acidoferrales bacterium]